MVNEDYDKLMKDYEQLKARVGELEKTLGMKDRLIGHQKARIKRGIREADSYLEEAIAIAAAAYEPAAVIGHVPEKKKFDVVLYVNEAFTKDLGWTLKEIEEREYVEFVDEEKMSGEEVKTALRGDKPEFRIILKNNKGKPERRIARKVDIKYITFDGKRGDYTVAFIRHPALFSDKGVKTIKDLCREYEEEEFRREYTAGIKKPDEKVQQALEKPEQSQNQD